MLKIVPCKQLKATKIERLFFRTTHCTMYCMPDHQAADASRKNSDEVIFRSPAQFFFHYEVLKNRGSTERQ